MQNIVFTSAEHKARLLEVMQRIGKIYDGELDTEYAAALYILTAHEDTWEQAGKYVSFTGIDFENLLNQCHFSNAYATLIELAGNLFNSSIKASPIGFATRLDDGNFALAISALHLRRDGMSASSLL